jgi:hypothetical protein
MQALKAALLDVAPTDAAHLSRMPASAVEVSAASTAAQNANALMVDPPSVASVQSARCTRSTVTRLLTQGGSNRVLHSNEAFDG